MNVNEPIVLEKYIKWPKKKRNVLMISIALAVVAAIIIIGVLIFLPKSESYSVQSFKYAIVKKGDLQKVLQLSGTVKTKDSQEILAPAHGIVDRILVEANDQVKKGNILLSLKSQDTEYNLETLKYNALKLELDLKKDAEIYEVNSTINNNQLKYLEEELQDRKLELQTQQGLYESNMISKTELISAGKKVKDAEKNCEDLKLRMQQVEIEFMYKKSYTNTLLDELNLKMQTVSKQLKDCLVSSSIDGTVTDILVKEGETIDTGEKIIEIQDKSRPVLEILVPENQIRSIRPGLEVSINLSGRAYRGIISRIGSSAEKRESTFDAVVKTEVSFTDIPDSVISGVSAEAEIILGAMKGVLYLPRGPYLTTGDQFFVYKIGGSRAVKTKVEFGDIDNANVVIAAGLEEGDKVIVSGYSDFINYDEIILSTDGMVEND